MLCVTQPLHFRLFSLNSHISYFLQQNIVQNIVTFLYLHCMTRSLLYTMGQTCETSERPFTFCCTQHHSVHCKILPHICIWALSHHVACCTFLRMVIAKTLCSKFKNQVYHQSWSESTPATVGVHPMDWLQINNYKKEDKDALKMKLAHALVLTLLDASDNIPISNFGSSLPTAETERKRERERGSAPRMCLLSCHSNRNVVSVPYYCIVLGQVASDHGCHIDD